MQKNTFAYKTGNITVLNIEETIKNLLLLGKKHSCILHAVKVKPIASQKHLFHALDQTIDSFSKGSNISKKPEIEAMLRLSGTRQFENALKILGLEKRRNEIVLFSFGKNAEKAVKEAAKAIGLKEDKNLLEKNLKKNFSYLKELYEIPDLELKALKDLGKLKALEFAVLEKIALIALQE